MDAIAGLLDGPRARGAFLLRAILDPPWSLRIRDEAPVTMVAAVRGEAWVIRMDGAPVRLGPGDAAIVRGPDHYSLADDPSTPTQVIIDPGQHCRAPGGESLEQPMALGVRTWGTSATGPTMLLIGTYAMPGEISGRLLGALPGLVVVGSDDLDTPLIPLLRDEIGKNDPGQEAVLDRLLDLLLISVLRAWFSREEAHPPGWYRAHSDPVVGPAVGMLHNNPSHPWTVAELAAETGLSRAAFARRFNDLVGEPPMTFLTGWRLALAADLLLEPGATVGSVADQVGYGSAFALSAAFKRVRGLSPREHRSSVLSEGETIAA